MAYVRTCASGTAEWCGMNRRKGVELKEGMEEMPLFYTLYSVEFQWNVVFLFARTICTKNMHTPVCTYMIPNIYMLGAKHGYIIHGLCYAKHGSALCAMLYGLSAQSMNCAIHSV